MTLSPECQSARMSKITNDGLNQSGTGCFISCTHMTTVGVKGLSIWSTLITGSPGPSRRTVTWPRHRVTWRVVSAQATMLTTDSIVTTGTFCVNNNNKHGHYGNRSTRHRGNLVDLSCRQWTVSITTTCWKLVYELQRCNRMSCSSDKWYTHWWMVTSWKPFNGLKLCTVSSSETHLSTIVSCFLDSLH